MTVELERTVEIDADQDAVWSFLSDPIERAAAISVVESVEADPDHARRTVWKIALPVPLIDKRVTVETRDVECDPPNFVRFVGRSSVMDLQGEHELSAIDGRTRVVSRFVVDGHVPGVERYFEGHLGGELDNLTAAFRARGDQEA